MQEPTPGSWKGGSGALHTEDGLTQRRAGDGRALFLLLVISDDGALLSTFADTQASTHAKPAEAGERAVQSGQRPSCLGAWEAGPGRVPAACHTKLSSIANTECGFAQPAPFTSY